MQPRPLPPALAGQPFTYKRAIDLVTYKRAIDLGATERRLRAGDLVVPHHGVRSLDGAADLVGRAHALWPVFHDDEFFAHVTALGLWGLPVPARHRVGPLHVGGTRTRQRRRPGVVGHRYRSGVALADVHGVRTAAPVEAWVQAAATLDLDAVITLGDALAGGWSPFGRARGVPVRELADQVRRARGRPGLATLRQAVESVRPRVDSPPETALRLLIVRGGLPEPEVNVPRFAADGSYLGKPDLSYAWCKLALEYQGDHHRTDRATWRVDLARRERFEDAGWRVVLISGDDLVGRAATTLLGRIRRHLADPSREPR